MLVSVVKKPNGKNGFETYDIVHEIMKGRSIEFARGLQVNETELNTFSITENGNNKMDVHKKVFSAPEPL